MDRGWIVFAAIVAGLIGLSWYVAVCRIWPYTDCPRCGGGGKRRSPSGRAWRRCRRCKGSGARVRLGRRMWSWLSAAKKAAVD